jgi:carbon-monoxide dehydrogenase large subunit
VDPAEVRRKNLLPPFTEPHTTAFGAVYDSGDYAAALDKALTAAGYQDLRAEQAKRRADGEVVQLGIGLSCYVEITGAGGEAGNPNENATVEVHPDGSATILTGTSPHGQGHETVWAMLASAELGIPIDKITLKWGDTDLIPQGGGTGGSRSLQQGGAAVQQASRELLGVARQRAADELEANPDDLVFDVTRSAFAVAGDPDVTVPLARLAEHERLLVRAVFTAPGATFPFGAHVAVAEVDTETGKAVLRRVVTVDDAGTVMNPLLAEGQRHGGIAQGATSWPTWRRRRPTTRSGPRASARPARSAPPPPCRAPSSTRWRTSACGTSTCPRRRSGSGKPSGPRGTTTPETRHLPTFLT